MLNVYKWVTSASGAVVNGLVYAAEGLGKLVGKGVAKAVPSVRIVQACYCITSSLTRP